MQLQLDPALGLGWTMHQFAIGEFQGGKVQQRRVLVELDEDVKIGVHRVTPPRHRPEDMDSEALVLAHEPQHLDRVPVQRQSGAQLRCRPHPLEDGVRRWPSARLVCRDVGLGDAGRPREVTVAQARCLAQLTNRAHVSTTWHRCQSPINTIRDAVIKSQGRKHRQWIGFRQEVVPLQGAGQR